MWVRENSYFFYHSLFQSTVSNDSYFSTMELNVQTKSWFPISCESNPLLHKNILISFFNAKQNSDNFAVKIIFWNQRKEARHICQSTTINCLWLRFTTSVNVQLAKQKYVLEIPKYTSRAYWSPVLFIKCMTFASTQKNSFRE